MGHVVLIRPDQVAVCGLGDLDRGRLINAEQLDQALLPALGSHTCELLATQLTLAWRVGEPPLLSVGTGSHAEEPTLTPDHQERLWFQLYGVNARESTDVAKAGVVRPGGRRVDQLPHR